MASPSSRRSICQFDLELDRLLHEAKRIEVLDLAPSAQRPAGLAHRHVGVAAKAALLHVAVADAEPHHQRVQGARVLHRLGGRAHVGLGHDLQQRRAGAVEVDARHFVRAVGGDALVHRLAGVFFQVSPRERDRAALLAHHERHPAAVHHGRLVLADLVALGQIGIEVVLAREDRLLGDTCTDSEAEADRAFHRRPVEHRQRAGQREVDRAGLRVGCGAEGRW